MHILLLSEVLTVSLFLPIFLKEAYSTGALFAYGPLLSRCPG
tara:strand:- start:62 stop:187 length:126 start_codon:yes stop_codon:yes gene_type:complete